MFKKFNLYTVKMQNLAFAAYLVQRIKKFETKFNQRFQWKYMWDPFNVPYYTTKGFAFFFLVVKNIKKSKCGYMLCYKQITSKYNIIVFVQSELSSTLKYLLFNKFFRF